MHRFFSGLRPTLLIAHRGGAALAPENTLPAFDDAVRQYGAAILETDVHLSCDGEVIVAHDETLDRCTDAEGPIAALRLAELKQIDAGYRFSPDGGSTFPFRGQGIRIPTLTEVLRAFPDARLNIEVKPNNIDAVNAVRDVITREGALDRVCIGSEVDDVAERLVMALPQACHFYPRLALTDLVFRLKSGQPPPPDGPYSVLDMPLYYEGMRLIDKPFLERVRALHKWVNVWVIDDPAEMRTLIDEGVFGIMTDRPDLLRQVLNEVSGS